jgi:hypothetical protein
LAWMRCPRTHLWPRRRATHVC